MRRPDLEELQLLHERLCTAVSDVTRIALLFELAEGPKHVSALVEAMGIPQGTVSRHLRVLYNRGLVAFDRDGTRVIYQLRDRRVIDALDLMRSVLADQLHRQSETAERIRTARRTVQQRAQPARRGGATARPGRKDV